mgnify:CR=1 FL=1
MGKVTAPDETFKIFTWFMVHVDGTYETFGLLQRYDKSTNKVKVYKLVDCASSMKDPMQNHYAVFHKQQCRHQQQIFSDDPHG